ncbi:MAG: PAS domain S-box protein [Bacteroidales bacterium]|nr:PAS domain S-box protein [Bacteroidales bacterium]
MDDVSTFGYGCGQLGSSQKTPQSAIGRTKIPKAKIPEVARAVALSPSLSQRQDQHQDQHQDQRQEWLRRSFEDAAIGMAVLAVDGQFLQVNRALCEMLGYSEAELLSLTVWAILYPEEQQASRTWAEQFSITPSPTAHTKTSVAEKRCLHQQGHMVWVQNACFAAPQSNRTAAVLRCSDARYHDAKAQ